MIRHLESIVNKSISFSFLSTLEEKNRDLSQVKINKMFRLMCDIRAEISPYNNMPRRIVFLVELPLNVRRHILEERHRTLATR